MRAYNVHVHTFYVFFPHLSMIFTEKIWAFEEKVVTLRRFIGLKLQLL